jgi:cytochrome c oxidase subunit 4
MAGHIVPPRTYYRVFVALIVLTVLTVGIDIVTKDWGIHLGALQTFLALLIATVKAALVILFFMHVLYSTKLTWVVALSSLLWLGILITYTLTDYVSRPALRIPGP